MAEYDFARYLQEVSEIGEVRAGFPLPLGTRQRGDGVNFALFSRHATRVWLEFYEQPDSSDPSQVIELIPERNRSGDIWHVWVQGVRSGQLYGYRVEGPYQPGEGHRFNPHKLLLDPYAHAITSLVEWDFQQALGYDAASEQQDLSYSDEDNAAAMSKCIATHHHFDWEEDQPLQHPWTDTVIYETHVRGLTIHPSSGAEHPGTYRGLAEKIPYLKDLGVTAVELLPVQEFNENALDRRNPLTGERLRDYWGYNPVSFFAPKAAYSRTGGLGQQILEFKRMVKELHRAGIEVILDVVFSHTAEGSEKGPTLSFRGIDNRIYYILQEDGRFYQDDTGTGNTINANHPVVQDLILDALRHWVIEMHVDGFRFDLASVLGRDEHGRLLPNPPLLERIAEDPILREAKIIAEAWDAAGAYQVGSFSERRWAEWNGRYRDDVRRFWRGDEGMIGLFASRICGSADIYQRSGKGPECSINYITSHDGFTLNDLVSYRHKHNEANGQDNEDGMSENYSENYGIEGETTAPEVKAVRVRQIKNFLLTLLVSRGVPMLVGGDEFRRTQQGNNNPYCQDNETSWYDWTLLGHHRDVHRFAQGMIAFRRAHPVLRRERFYTEAEIHFFDPSGQLPRWQDPQARSLGCLLPVEDGYDLYMMFNGAPERVVFHLPAPGQGRHWQLAVDTMRPSPQDLLPPGEEVILDDGQAYAVGPRTAVILLAR